MVRQTICWTWGFHSRNSKTLWRRQLRQSQCQRQADLVKDGSQFGTFGLKLPRSEGLVKCVLAHHGITHMAQHGIPSNPNTYIILYLTICIYVYYTSSSLSLYVCVYIYTLRGRLALAALCWNLAPSTDVSVTTRSVASHLYRGA